MIFVGLVPVLHKEATLSPLDYERASYDVVCFKRMELIEGSRHSLCSMHSSMKQREYSMEKTLNRRDSCCTEYVLK